MQMRLACLLVATTAHHSLAAAAENAGWEAVLKSRLDHHVDRTATSAGRPPHPQPPFARGASAAPGGAGLWSVTAFGATADNKTDNTGAFAKALAACGSAGGGEVTVPPGLYRFSGNLTIPQGCTLSGSYKKVPSHSPPCPGCFPVFAGSVLLPTGGRGDGSCSVPLQSPNGGVPCKTAFITLLVDSDLRGFVVYYPEQNHQTTPVPYPWTVFMSGTNSAVQDLECLNCWDAVAAVNAGRHYIARVQGQPLNIGVFVDQTYDIGRIEDVHFNPWWSAEQPMIFWQTTHGRAFVFGRSDWEYVLNTFAFGYAIGYHFIECEDNNGGPGNMNGNFLGIGMDLATNSSVQVDASQPMGLLITNGEFTAFRDPKGIGKQFVDPSVGPPDPAQVRINENNTGAVKFVNCAFWGPTNSIAVVGGQGTTTFDSCGFVQWDLVHHDATPAIVQNSGSLLLNGNEFQSAGVQLHIGAAAKKTVVSANIGVGPLNITGAKGGAVIANNAFDHAAAGAVDEVDARSEPPSLRARLLELGSLLEERLISQAEYDAARRSALGI